MKEMPFPSKCDDNATLLGPQCGLCWQGAVIRQQGGAGCLTSGLSGNPTSTYSIETLAVKLGGADSVMALSGVGEGA